MEGGAENTTTITTSGGSSGSSSGSSSSSTKKTKTPTPLQQQWEIMFEGLKEFYRVPEGEKSNNDNNDNDNSSGSTCAFQARRIPHAYLHAGKSLSGWARTQRKWYKKIQSNELKMTELYKSRIRRLQEIGFVFDTGEARVSTNSSSTTTTTARKKNPKDENNAMDVEWEEYYRGLLSFFQQVKSFHVPKNYTHEGKRIDLWLAEQQLLWDRSQQQMQQEQSDATTTTATALTPKEQRRLERLLGIGCPFPLPYRIESETDNNNNKSNSTVGESSSSSSLCPSEARTERATTAATSTVGHSTNETSLATATATATATSTSTVASASLGEHSHHSMANVAATSTTFASIAAPNDASSPSPPSQKFVPLPMPPIPPNFQWQDWDGVDDNNGEPIEPFSTEEEYIQATGKLLYDLDQEILRAEWEELLVKLDRDISEAEAAEKIAKEKEEKKKRPVYFRDIEYNNHNNVKDVDMSRMTKTSLDWPPLADVTFSQPTETSTGWEPDSTEQTTLNWRVKASLLIPKCLKGLGSDVQVTLTPEDVVEDLIPSNSLDGLSQEQQSDFKVRLVENKQNASAYTLHIMGHRDAVERFRTHYASWLCSTVQARKTIAQDSNLVTSAAAKRPSSITRTKESSLVAPSSQLALNWQIFRRKFIEAVKFEFSRSAVNMLTVLSHMWDRHKELIGSECPETCGCIFRMTEMLEGFAVGSHSEPLKPLGFMTQFASRFLNDLKHDHPEEIPEKLLQRLMDLYRTEPSLRRPQGNPDHSGKEGNLDGTSGGAILKSKKIPRKRKSADEDTPKSFRFDGPVVAQAKATDSSADRIPKKQKVAKPSLPVTAGSVAKKKSVTSATKTKPSDSLGANIPKKKKPIINTASLVAKMQPTMLNSRPPTQSKPSNVAVTTGAALTSNVSANDPLVGSRKRKSWHEAPSMTPVPGAMNLQERAAQVRKGPSLPPPPLARQGSIAAETAAANNYFPLAVVPKSKQLGPRPSILKKPGAPIGSIRVTWKKAAGDHSQVAADVRLYSKDSYVSNTLPGKNQVVKASKASPSTHQVFREADVVKAVRQGTFRDLLNALEGGGAAKIAKKKLSELKNDILVNKEADFKQKLLDIYISAEQCVSLSGTTKGWVAFSVALDKVDNLQGRVMDHDSWLQFRAVQDKSYLLLDRKIPLASVAVFEPGTGFFCYYNQKQGPDTNILFRFRTFKNGVEGEGDHIGTGCIRLKDLYQRCVEYNPDQHYSEMDAEKWRLLSAKLTPYVYDDGAHIEPGAQILYRVKKCDIESDNRQQKNRDQVAGKIRQEVIQKINKLNQCTPEEYNISANIQVAGSTLLHAAISAFDDKLVEELVSLGADPMTKNSNGVNAISFARNLADGQTEGAKTECQELNLKQQRIKARRRCLNSIVEILNGSSSSAASESADVAPEDVPETEVSSAVSESFNVLGASVPSAAADEGATAGRQAPTLMPGAIDMEAELCQGEVDGSRSQPMEQIEVPFAPPTTQVLHSDHGVAAPSDGRLSKRIKQDEGDGLTRHADQQSEQITLQVADSTIVASTSTSQDVRTSGVTASISRNPESTPQSLDTVHLGPQTCCNHQGKEGSLMQDGNYQTERVVAANEMLATPSSQGAQTYEATATVPHAVGSILELKSNQSDHGRCIVVKVDSHVPDGAEQIDRIVSAAETVVAPPSNQVCETYAATAGTTTTTTTAATKTETTAPLLPTLGSGWLHKDISESERCTSFDGLHGCNRGSDCPYWHVYKPIGRALKKCKLSELAKGDVFEFCRQVREADNGDQKWFTAGYRDAYLRKVFYAEGLYKGMGHQSDSGVWWYPLQSSADAALRLVVSFATKGEVFDEAVLSSIKTTNKDAPPATCVVPAVAAAVQNVSTQHAQSLADDKTAAALTCSNEMLNLPPSGNSNRPTHQSEDAAVSREEPIAQKDVHSVCQLQSASTLQADLMPQPPQSSVSSQLNSSLNQFDRTRQQDDEYQHNCPPSNLILRNNQSAGVPSGASVYGVERQPAVHASQSLASRSHVQPCAQPVAHQPSASGREGNSSTMYAPQTAVANMVSSTTHALPAAEAGGTIINDNPSLRNSNRPSRLDEHAPSLSRRFAPPPSSEASQRGFPRQTGMRSHNSRSSGSSRRDSQHQDRYRSGSNSSSYYAAERQPVYHATTAAVPVPPRPSPAPQPRPPPSAPPVGGGEGADINDGIPQYDEDDLPLDWKTIPPHCPPFNLPRGSDNIRVDSCLMKWFHKKWIFR